MASCLKLCFLASLLLLSTTALLVVSAAEPVRNTTSPAPSPLHPQASRPSGEYRTFIILLWPPTDRDGSAMDEAAPRQWHASFLPTKLTYTGEPRLLRSYRFNFNGFAARLTEAELEPVEKKPGFLRSFPDRVRHLLTTRTLEFLGLTRDAGAWRDTSYGKGVVIGVIDSGHPSLDDHGIASPPVKWKGSCQGGVRCNHKLVGAKTFLDGNNVDPSDDDGHGTHTATTAAGNFVDGASFNGLASGTATGIASGAHVATYKACNAVGCNDAAILHAMH